MEEAFLTQAPKSRNYRAHRKKYKAIQLRLEEGQLCSHAVAMEVMVAAQRDPAFFCALKVLLKKRVLPI